MMEFGVLGMASESDTELNELDLDSQQSQKLIRSQTPPKLRPPAMALKFFLGRTLA